VSVGYGTNLPSQHIDFLQAKNYWYHWLMATSKGAELVKNDPKGFAKIMWDTWSPPGWYSNEEFEITAQAFDNPDWLDVTLHSYSHRWGHAPSDPYYANDESVLLQIPRINIPTLMLHGMEDSVSLPKTSEAKEHFFSGHYERKLLPKIGHFPQRENPDLIARELVDFLEQH
jgi:pimeloyl-ACP methyl ester carboxylesterase